MTSTSYCRSPLTKLIAEGGADNDEFGYSVAVYRDTAVIGAHQHDVNGNANAGAAYVFTRDPLSREWSQPIKLTASDGDEDDRFGHSVAVVGDTVVVGAYGDDGNRGAAYVFTKTGGAWTSTTTAAKLTASDGEANDEFRGFRSGGRRYCCGRSPPARSRRRRRQYARCRCGLRLHQASGRMDQQH